MDWDYNSATVQNLLNDYFGTPEPFNYDEFLNDIYNWDAEDDFNENGCNCGNFCYREQVDMMQYQYPPKPDDPEYNWEDPEMPTLWLG